ncbi:MAG: methylated-DNA--[protein]-cysteine S-methyltransferase [Phycisphaeraceae bacterium]|nr:methylated-DNA--[protein]-cysteine S-methyltransferase [Phycisphaeraceae bacterium]
MAEVLSTTGFASPSGYRDAFASIFGNSEGTARLGGVMPVIFARWIDTPIGAMLALADDAGLRVLDFVDRRGLPRQIVTIRRVLACAVVPGEHAQLDAVERELGLYFAGKPSAITTTSHQAGLEAKVGGIVLAPIGPGGTPGGSAFQRAVWGELRRIPSGRTRSYAEQARAVGKPLGVRAVARANGENFLSLIIPCHRVIGSDGSMTGYSGGVARKRWLLEHEAKMAGVSVAGLFAGVGVGG